MNDDRRVSDDRPHKIHMGTSTQDSDAVMKKISSYSCYLSPRWLEQRLNSIPCRSTPEQLHSTKRKLKRIVSGHSHTYRWVHAAYYGVLSAVGTTSLWWCRGKETISFVDCIFNVVSALTATGLSSVPIRDFTPLGLLILMVLMLLGNTVFVSLLPVYVRRLQLFRHDRALNSASNAAVKLGLNQHCNTSHTTVDVALAKQKSSSAREAIDISKDISKPDWNSGSLKTGADRQGDGMGVCAESKSEIIPIGKVASTCCGKSCQGQESLQADHDVGLLERQALITLSWLVPIYMFVIMAFGFICIICYTSFSSKGSSRVGALYEAEGVNPVHTAIFLSVSAFSNTGLSPLDENMVPFAASQLVLVPLAVLILAGNTLFPPSLRFIIWGLSILKRTDDPQRKVYEYLLQFPRRCYTHLFPPMHTMWLVATVVAFNTMDLVAFCAFEWNSAAVKAGSNAAVKLMDGLFQSLNTRSAGMNVLPLSSLSPALLVLYTSMMYVAAYPVFLSRQHSRLTRTDVNLHQYSDKCVSENFKDAGDNKISLQFTKLFTRDSVYIFIQVFLICTVEIRNLNSDPLNYTILSIVFEVVSAYGSVGLSLGYSCAQWVRASANTPYAEAAAACKDVPNSFSGKWSVVSQLILVGGMLLGRHRSLPDDMDAAIPVVMPSELCDSCQRSRSDPPHRPNPNFNPNFIV